MLDKRSVEVDVRSNSWKKDARERTGIAKVPLAVHGRCVCRLHNFAHDDERWPRRKVSDF